MTKSFTELGLDDVLVGALKHEGIVEPTEIQEAVIPLILANRDVIGESQTGTGKTLAYLLPMMQLVDVHKKETQVMILAPTHELAIQILRQIERVRNNAERELGVTATSLVGNVNIARQIEKLKEKPHIIVGSSGRILELIQKKKINAQAIKTIVLDEADRLLDEKNVQSTKAVIKTTLKDRQLLLFSATLSPKILEQLSDSLKNPEVIRVTEKARVASSITHEYFLVEQRDKFEVLRKLIRMIKPQRALIFVNQTEQIEMTVEKLNFHGLTTVGLHGSAIKSDRQKAMEDFRTGKISLLVASDLAARGLDIKGVTHIFNLELSEDPQIYLHRVGRTGRAGEEGTAISILSARELPMVKKIENTFGISISLKEMFGGKIIEPRPIMSKRQNRTKPPKKVGKR